MKVIIAAAQTGGHINPGIAIANKIKEKDRNARIMFIGTTRGLENDLVPRAGYELKTINAYGINRNELSDILKSHNIYSRKYFYPISNEFDCYEGCKGETPIAKDVSERVLALPLYPDLGMQNVERICKIIRERR